MNVRFALLSILVGCQTVEGAPINDEDAGASSSGSSGGCAAPAPICGETTDGPACGCGAAGTREVRDGGVYECQSARCWQFIGPAPVDAGADSSADASDAG